MRRTNSKIIGGILLVTILLVAVGYAAITKVGLNIDGTAKSEGNPDNFKVELIGEPQTSGDGTTTATINTADKTQGTMNVSGLNAKGQTAIATYTVKNQSTDLSADLTAKATSTNDEYFEVQCSLEKTTLKAGEETTMTVKVKLLKTPIDETKENLLTEIGVNIDAEPKQPGEENNGGSITVVNKKTTNPYLPEGFTKVGGTSLSNGYTIQDSKGNQYVWVEVPMTDEVYPTAGLNIKNFTTEEYTEIEEDLHAYTSDYRNGTSFKDEYYSEEATGLTSGEYIALKQKMLKSVYQNGGFYIGKYETGIEDAPRTSGSPSIAPTEIPIIKQNAYPYNYVTCSQAQTLASGMVKSENYTSSLMFGVQWDLVLKYLETKGTAKADLKTNSTNWGNYANNSWNITNENSKYAPNGSGWTSGAYGKKDSNKSVLLSTGASETFSKQGIYDIAGNVWEWTLEYTAYSSTPCAKRGGYYSSYGSGYPAAYRNGSSTTNYYDNIGFRLSLY